MDFRSTIARARSRPKKQRSYPARSCLRSFRFGSGAQDVVPVTPLDGGAKPREWDPEFFAKRSVAVCEAVARSIGVRSAAEKRAGEHCDVGQQRLERGDRAWAHASACRGIERVPAEALDGCDTQRVDRGLGENQPRERWTLREQAEERFRSACQRTFVGRSAHVDMGDNAVTIAMGEPGAAGRPLPQDAGRRGSLDNRGGEPSLSHEIPPGRRIGPNSLSLGPAFNDGPLQVIPAPCPVDWWEARRQSREFAQALADVAEAQAWLEPLHQPEDVALGVASWIPPPAPGVADNQDFAFASPVLQAEFRALLPIQFPRRRGSLQHHGAMHPMAQFLDFRVVSGHVRSSRFERRSWAQWPWACFRPCPARRPRGGRAARARGTRGSLRRTLRGANGASGSHFPLLCFSREGSAATARTRNWAHVEGLDAKRPPRGQRL